MTTHDQTNSADSQTRERALNE